MGDKEQLISNIEKIHTTLLGVKRIQTNLSLVGEDVVQVCKEMILDRNSSVYRKGKNWYIELDDNIVTINAYSYTIITAHKIKKENRGRC